MFNWFRGGQRVLAIGSIHLDTIAFSRSPDTQEDVTLIGNIVHSVGSSAYNIAANLASRHGRASALRDVAVYTILPQHSVLTEIIKYKIDAAGIDSRFVRLYRDFNNRRVRGGGYVGILDDQRLIRQAVVDAAMHDANIFQDRSERAYLEAAIDWADMLVLDADLSVSTVNHVCEHAHDHGKPLFMSIGSPKAGLRGWIHGHEENTATCLSGRLGVLSTILEEQGLAQSEIGALRAFVEEGKATNGFDVNAICRLLRAKSIVTSNVRQSRGFVLCEVLQDDVMAFGSRATVGRFFAREHPHQRGLAGAVHADKRHAIAALDVQVHLLEHDARAIGLADVLQFEHGTAALAA